MGIKQVTPNSEIMAATMRSVDAFVESIIYNLSYIGEKAVNEARTSHSYTDQTGNLTASMGYGVFKDGEPVFVSDFLPVKGSDDGPDVGKAFLLSLSEEFPKGITLVVVAGKHYAKYVAAKGYNVLDSSERLARTLVEELIKNR